MENVKLVPADVKAANLANIVKFTNKLKARDKLLRLAQYYLKFLVYRLEQTDPKSDLAKRAKLLSSGMGLHRKAFKLGAWLDEIQKFQELQKNGKTDMKQTLNLILKPVMGLFIFVDNMVYFTSLKVTDWNKDELKMKAYKLRLTAALLQTAIGYLDLDANSKKIEGAKSAEDKEKAMEKQGQLVVGLGKCVLDVTTYLNSAKYIQVNDGTIGLIGAGSSLCALWSIWLK